MRKMDVKMMKMIGCSRHLQGLKRAKNIFQALQIRWKIAE